MDLDIGQLLENWPYEPGKLNVRMIKTGQGHERLQIRLDLGLLQMHVDGRPDGLRPDGFESLLELFEARVDARVTRDPGPDANPETNPETGIESDAIDRDPRGPERPRDHADDHPDDHPAESGDDAPGEGPGSGEPAVTFTAEECHALRDEAVQYYHRYLALLALDEYERVVRDTTRNLRVSDLVRKHGQGDNRGLMEPFRPSITMMRARALASLAMRSNETKAALLALDEGLEGLRQHYAQRGEPEQFESSNEAMMLQSIRDALVPKLPVSQKAELTERLRQALDSENYRLAAILRDELELIDRTTRPQGRGGPTDGKGLEGPAMGS